MKYTIPCLFGLEALVADELRRLDLKNVRAENGRVHCDGGPAWPPSPGRIASPGTGSSR